MLWVVVVIRFAFDIWVVEEADGADFIANDDDGFA